MLECAAYCRTESHARRNAKFGCAVLLKEGYPILYEMTAEEIDELAAEYEEKARGM